MIHIHFAYEDYDEMRYIINVLDKVSGVEFIGQEWTLHVQGFRFDFYFNLDNIEEIHVYKN